MKKSLNSEQYPGDALVHCAILTYFLLVFLIAIVAEKRDKVKEGERETVSDREIKTE